MAESQGAPRTGERLAAAHHRDHPHEHGQRPGDVAGEVGPPAIAFGKGHDQPRGVHGTGPPDERGRAGQLAADGEEARRRPGVGLLVETHGRDERLRTREAIDRSLGQAAIDGVRERRRQLRGAGGDRRHRLRGVLHEQRGRGVGLERRTPGGGEVQRDAERVQVGPTVHDIAQRLLRRHEARGAEHAVGRRVPVVAESGDAEVGEQKAPADVLDEDVVGLHVAVHDAAFMRVGQRPPHFAGEPAHVVRRERPVAVEATRERFAAHPRHDEPREVTALLDGVHGHDVRMEAARGRARLAQESRPHVGAGGELRGQQLDRDGPLEPDVPGEVHDPHAAASEFALDGEAAGDGALEREAGGIGGGREGGGHG